MLFVLAGCSAPRVSTLREMAVAPKMVAERFVLREEISVPVRGFLDVVPAKEIYLRYDVVEAARYDYAYAHGGEGNVIMELCRMKDDLQAYGLGREIVARKPDSRGAVFSRGAVTGWAVPRGQASMAEAQSVALAVAASMAGTPEPREVKAFLAVNVDSATIKYGDADFNGNQRLRGLLGEALRPDSRRIRIFLARGSSPEEAQAMFDSAVKSIAFDGRGIAFTIGVGDVAATVRSEAWGWMSLSRDGRYFLAARGGATADESLSEVSALVRALHGLGLNKESP